MNARRMMLWYQRMAVLAWRRGDHARARRLLEAADRLRVSA